MKELFVYGNNLSIMLHYAMMYQSYLT